MGETPEEKYERISKAVRDSILRHYPNPERRGCPGDDMVRSVAARSELSPDTLWEHITHCSPCYAVFLRSKRNLRKHAAYRRALFSIAASAVMGIGSWIAIYSIRPHGTVRDPTEAKSSSPPSREPQELGLTRTPLMISVDLRSQTAYRGSYNRIPPARIKIPQRPVGFHVLLPFASDDGSYQVEVLDAQKHLNLTTTGTAVLVSNATALNVPPLDFTRVSVGEYLLRFRHGDSTWHSVPVTIQSLGPGH